MQEEHVINPNKKHVIVGIPLFNSEETVASIILSCSSYSDEVVCIDDCSTDSSAEVARKAGATVISHEINRGVGGVAKTLFRYAKEKNATIVILIDSDGQHDPEDLPKLIKPLNENKADLVIGSRFVSGGKSKNMPSYRKFGLKLINTVSKWHSKQLVRDTQSGYRGFNKKAIDTVRFENEGMKSSLEILESISDKGLRILEIPTTIRYDLKNTSSLHPIPHGLSVFSYALTTLSQKKPLLVFGLPGLSMIIIGAMFGLRTINHVSEWTGLTVGPGVTFVWIGALGIPLLVSGIVLQYARKVLNDSIQQ
jgi:glycosyltransferase involved in cell wall biosynthesis